MSIRIMSLTYAAHFHDITFVHKGKKKSTGIEYEKIVKVMNFNIKSVCLALADHANDEGEGAYPAVETIASKTEISDVTVIACLKAMKQEGIISYTGRSKWDTCSYTINKSKLAEMATWERQKREKVKSKAASVLEGSKAASVSEIKPLDFEDKVALPESSSHPEAKEAATPRLSSSELQEIQNEANKKVDALLENERKLQAAEGLGQAWRGRELLPPQYLIYGDWWHAKTHQHMYGQKGKQKINTEWLKAFKQFYEHDISIAVLEETYEAEIAWKKVIAKPSELVSKAIAIQALPPSVEKSEQSVSPYASLFSYLEGVKT